MLRDRVSRASQILRLTGAQLASIEPPIPEEWFIDFDEHEDFIVAPEAGAYPAARVSLARLYDALWLLKNSRYGDDDEFPTLAEVRVALSASFRPTPISASATGVRLEVHETADGPETRFVEVSDAD